MRNILLLNIVMTFILVFLSGCGEDFLPGANRKTYGNMTVYKERLEQRLLHQYKNHPLFGKKVSRVELDVVKDIKSDVSHNLRKVEFSQLVYDNWGNRIPELEKEYFVVTFGPKNMRKVSMPRQKISVGLDVMGSYSEHTPVTAGDVGQLRQQETLTKGLYCPVCGARVSQAGICPKCSNMNKPEFIGKTLKPDYSTGNTVTSEQFEKDVTRKVRQRLKLESMKENYTPNNTEPKTNSYGDLRIEQFNPNKKYKFQFNQKLGGTENLQNNNLPSNDVIIKSHRLDPSSSRKINDMRKNIEQQTTKAQIRSVQRTSLPLEQEDKDFGVVGIESRPKAELMMR